jgi:DNA-binding NarL/FixJ family response regulator
VNRFDRDQMTKADREQMEIQLCLNCPLPDCVNCLEKTEYNPLYVQRMHKVIELSELGMNDTQMATRLGVCSSTVRAIRKKLGIPSAKERAYGRAAGI